MLDKDKKVTHPSEPIRIGSIRNLCSDKAGIALGYEQTNICVYAAFAT